MKYKSRPVRSTGRFLPLYLSLALAAAFQLVSTPSVSTGRTIPEDAYASMKWRLVGPFRGGRALAAAGVPGNPYIFYFGSVDGGMWKTENAGVTWKSISDGLTNPSVGALAIAPSDPKVIYVGTGEADMRSDITYGDGVYRSTDAGENWKHIGLDDTRQIGRILVDPRNPDIVLVAALGHAYGPNDERGVFKTTDGGRSWKRVLFENPNVGAIDIGWDPGNPEVIYAAMWQARRTPWSQYPPDEGPGSGIFKSTDEGGTWNEVGSSGLPPKPYGRIGIAVVNGSHGNSLYAIIQDLKKGSGLYRSDDGGQTWRLAGDDPRIVQRMWYFSEVAVDPVNPQIVYCPNVALMRSTDGGKHFTPIKGAPGGDDYHHLWIDPNDDQRMIVASDQGTVVSEDGGKTWSSWYNQPTAQFYHVATDNRFPFRIYGAQQDAGTVSIASRSDYGSITFRDWYSIGAGESGYIAPDPGNPDVVYGGDTYGGVFRFDRLTGQSQVISPSVLAEFGKPISSRKYRFTWTSPIVFDPEAPGTIYLGAQRVLRTTDGGLSWKAISPDLTRKGTPGMPDPSHSGWGVVYTIAPSPLKRGIIWAGTDDGVIQLTSDGGRNWKNVTPAGLPAWSKVSMIDASHFDAAEAYAAVDRHRLDDLRPYIYRTTDFGKHWEMVDEGIDTHSYVNVVRSDPSRKGLLYAGTEEGVYVSFDDGSHWQSLQLNLPTVSVRDLAVHDGDLVAATHGRAFWVLDDVSPLRELTGKVLSDDAFLFRPEPAVRIRRSVNSDTPLPPEEPQGKNPPAGAIIDYYLKSEPAGGVKLEILDASGNVVRSYSSGDTFHFGNARIPVAAYWFPKPVVPGSRAGHNRFVWDLRYSPPPVRNHQLGMDVANGKSVVEPEGPLVLPGNYRVRLTVGGKSYSQPLIIRMDPRVGTGISDLRDQLRLAIDVWNETSDAASLSGVIDSVAVRVDRIKRESGSNVRLRSLADSVLSEAAGFKVSQVAGELSGLEGDIMSADRRPTEQMSAAFGSLRSDLSNLRTRWKNLEKTRLSALDAVLARDGMSPVTIPPDSAAHLKMP